MGVVGFKAKKVKVEQSGEGQIFAEIEVYKHSSVGRSVVPIVHAKKTEKQNNNLTCFSS